MKIGIIGAGKIAAKMAETLQPFETRRYAIASRDLSRAREFADKWGFRKAYGSYEELVSDPEVELVYIATPHSHHLAHASLAINHGKPVLCEKSFTANAREARELISLAHSKGVFITEAIWTRYMPLSLKVNEILESGVLGKLQFLSASIGYPMLTKERLFRPELAGGALLDVGVYAINFARMYFGADIESTVSQAVLNETGMDMQNTISLKYKDGRMANLQSMARSANDLQGIISGQNGFLVVDNINNPGEVKVYSKDHQLLQTYTAEGRITGYEYEVFACEEAVANGWLESPYMPHAETIAIMEQMDALRAEWGVRFPMDL